MWPWLLRPAWDSIVLLPRGAAMGRYKGVIGLRLRARSLLAQQTEAAIGVTILNRMLAWGSPKSAQRQAGDFPRRAIHLNIANRAIKLSQFFCKFILFNNKFA